MPLSPDVSAARLIGLAVENAKGQLQSLVQVTPDATAPPTRQVKVSGPEAALNTLVPGVKGKSGGAV